MDKLCIENSEIQLKYAQLTQQQAEQRSSSISACEYNLHFEIDEESISGIVLIKFVSSATIINIDFCGQRLKGVIVNENTWNADQIQQNWKNHQIAIETIDGSNFVTIAFEIEFSKTEFGLTKYKQGQNVYIFSLFAPNYCHSCFPCFDQPDIKAEIRLDLVIDQEWKAISNMNPIQVTQYQESQSQWSFPKTPKISTYLFSINMGNWQEKQFTLKNDIQMNLYLEKERMPNLIWQERLIKQCIEFGFEFYEKLFNIPFPFQKYDLIFCSNFYFSGMEHPGAVLLTKNYIQRHQLERGQLTQFCNLLLHELSHMWFGNLVTMKWWNALWLNEAFAVYISYKAQSQFIQEFNIYCKDSDIHYMLYKQGGVNLDINPDSHPIEMDIQDACQGLQAFDQITYNKGSAVLCTLVNQIGFNHFIDVVREFLNKFQWSNATTNDLFNLIQTQNIDIQRWKHEFIEKNGINLFEVITQGEQLIIKQSSVSGNSIRQHKLNVMLIGEENIYVQLQINQQYHYLCENNLYKAIILNYDDSSYCIQTIDENSLEYLLPNFNTLNLTLQIKISIINNLFQMTYILNTFKIERFFYFIICQIDSNIHDEMLNFMITKFLILYNKLTVQQQIIYGELMFDQLQNLLKLQLHKNLIYTFIGNFAWKFEHIDYIFMEIKSQPVGSKNTQLLGQFLNCFFNKTHLIEEDRLQEYQEFWNTFKGINHTYSLRQMGAQKTPIEIEQYFDDLLEGQVEYHDIEQIIRGMNNECSPNYDQYITIYMNKILKLCQTLDQHRKLIVLKEGFPTQGDQDQQMKILNEIDTKYPDLKFTINLIRQSIVQRKKVQSEFIII